MSKYWNRINLKIGSILRLRAQISAEKNEDYIEALVLQAPTVEAFLRTLITQKTGSRKQSHRKYWDGDAKFSQLIIYYELLGGKEKLIKDLLKYNKTRNKIVHETLQYSSVHELIKDAKLNYELGVSLIKKMLKILGFKIPADFDKPFNE